jgi:FAD:protein FMN transferase
MKTLTFTAMGSPIFIALDTDDQDVVAEAMKAKQWFEEWEQNLSRFRISSELSEINRHPGVAKHVTPVFTEIMLAAEKAEKLSGGLVTPAVLNALITAGYRDDFDTLLERTENEFQQALFSPTEAGKVKFDRRNHTVELPFGTQLDFGGIAKGWAAHQVMLRLGEMVPVLVDAGGDIAISGLMHSKGRWPVGVANPFDQDNTLALLMIENGGIATSGKDYHRWMFNGAIQHHIIDPRTMRPAETDILTITVMASNVMDAEVYAKAALIKGGDYGKRWLDEQPGIAYLIVLEDGTLIRNEEFTEYEWKPEWQIN